MAFNWEEFLDLAIALQTGRSDYPHDAALRSAVSRAYFAAYCIARDYARDKEGLSLANKPSDHSLVRRHYLRHGREDLASELDDLRQWRNVCDYEDEIKIDLSVLVEIAIQNASDVIEILSQNKSM